MRGIAVVALLFASMPAAAGIDFPTAVNGFGGAVDTRRDPLAGLPSPTAAEVKEKAALDKIISALESYDGGSDAADLALAGKALAGAYKSSSQDLFVGGAADDLFSALEGLADEARDEAVAERDRLGQQANRDTIDAALAKVDASVEAIEDLTDWGKIAKAFGKAIAAYGKVTVAALKAQAKEASGPASIACQWTGVNFNGDAKASTAVWNSGTGGFGVTAQMPGNPLYVLTLSATGVFAPGTFSLPVAQ